MKFNRVVLMHSITDRIDTVLNEAKQKYEADLNDYYVAKAEWLASDHPEYFREEAANLTAKSWEDVVTYDDLKPFGDRWSDHSARPHVFSKSKPEYREPDTSVLLNLRKFLESVTDDEVSSSGLRDVGFRNIAQILRNAS